MVCPPSANNTYTFSHQSDINTRIALCAEREMAERLAASSRHQYVYNGTVVYEWDQSLTEVNVYVRTPPGITAKQLYCRIHTDTLVFGLGNNDPYLDVRTRCNATHRTTPTYTISPVACVSSRCCRRSMYSSYHCHYERV